MHLLQILLGPLLFIFIAYVAGVKWGAKAGWVAFAPLAYSTFLTLMAGLQGGVAEFYQWSPIGYSALMRMV